MCALITGVLTLFLLFRPNSVLDSPVPISLCLASLFVFSLALRLQSGLSVCLVILFRLKPGSVIFCFLHFLISSSDLGLPCFFCLFSLTLVTTGFLLFIYTDIFYYILVTARISVSFRYSLLLSSLCLE